MSNLINLTRDFFKDFLPDRCGYPFNQNQLDLALDVVGLLTGHSVAPLLAEAETGTGKTLAYLVPTCLYLSLNPDSKIAISTQSRTLQLQIAQEMERVRAFLDQNNLECPSSAIYQGKNSYLSEVAGRQALSDAKANGSINALQLDVATQILIEEVQADCAVASFLLRLEENGIFLNVNSSDLSVGTGDARLKYDQERTKAEAAQLVIYSHIALLSGSQYGWLDDSYHAILFDEADTIEGVCALLGRTQIAQSTLVKLSDSLSDLPSNNKSVDLLRNAIRKTISLIELYIVSVPLSGVSTAHLSAEDSAELQHYAGTLSRNSAELAECLVATYGADINIKIQKKLESVSDIMAQMARGGSFAENSVTQSKSGKRTLVSELKQSAWIARKLIASTPKTALFSATLSDTSERGAFNEIKRFLDVSQATERHYAPTEFGRLSFSVVSEEFPQPFLRNGQGHNHEWIRSVVSEVNQEIAAGGRVLLLTPSHAEAELLLLQSGAADWISHGNHKSIAQACREFSEKGGVLVSASLWAGFSMRMPDGSQLFDKLVITRMPIPSSEEIVLTAIKRRLAESGSNAIAEDILYGSNIKKAVRKLRQGIGRAIRHPDDSAKVIFLDHRMSIQGRHRHSIQHAIPERFSGEYLSHARQDGVSSESLSNVPWELL